MGASWTTGYDCLGTGGGHGPNLWRPRSCPLTWGAASRPHSPAQRKVTTEHAVPLPAARDLDAVRSPDEPDAASRLQPAAAGEVRLDASGAGRAALAVP